MNYRSQTSESNLASYNTVSRYSILAYAPRAEFKPHSALSYDVLPFAIAELKKAGYRMVTMAECLGMPAYQNVTNPGTPDVSGS